MIRYRFVIFDLDGTLIDSYQALTIALNRCGADYLDAPYEVEEVRGLVGEGVERLLQKAFHRTDLSEALIASFEREYERVCCDESRLLDHVEATLRQLNDLGVKMAVCTNKPTAFSRQIIAHLELSAYLPFVVGPDRAGSRKPDAAHVNFTLREMEGDRASALFVGDMPIDIDAARAAGLPVAAIATGSSSADELRARNPDYMLERLSDLIPLVRGVPAIR